MYFSRITINVGTADADELVSLVSGNVYAFHRVLWRLFPNNPNAQRDFLFRTESGNGWLFFYLVSKRCPQPVPNIFKLETKPYDPALTEGQHLSFGLRANPVVTRKVNGGNRIARHDIIMDAKNRIAADPSSAAAVSSKNEIEYEEGIKWLQRKSEKLGFTFDPRLVRVFGYRQHRFKSRKQDQAIQFSSLDFTGKLWVTDPDTFRWTLFNGIGRSKAFGCGLMLVRRI